MSDLNSYSFTGRLGADAETKHTNNGTAVWSARVGVGYGYGDKKGTNWITVQVFGKRAEALAKLDILKGAPIAVSGEFRIREYDKNDGSKGYAHEVSAENVALLGSKPQGEPDRQAAKPQRRPAEVETDDTIPF